MAEHGCFYCERPAEHQCPTCGRLYCDEHGAEACLRCLAPESAMPSAWTYRGTLVALLAGIAVTIYLLVSPPREREQAGATRPAASPTATPTRSVTATPATRVASPTPSPTVTGPTATPSPGAARTYTVESGDTLSEIAERFGTTVDAIVALNPGIDPNSLQLGQVIVLPPEGQ